MEDGDKERRVITMETGQPLGASPCLGYQEGDEHRTGTQPQCYLL